MEEEASQCYAPPALGRYLRGDWRRGKYAGRRLPSPTTGYSFIGRFSAGKMWGGALVPRVQRHADWNQNNGMTFKECIEFALAEKAKDAARRTQDRDAAFAVRLAVKLNTYVESVKETIALKREEAALEAERIRREKLAEQKKRQEEMREKALMLLAKSADDDAEDIVTTKKDATDGMHDVPSPWAPRTLGCGGGSEVHAAGRRHAQAIRERQPRRRRREEQRMGRASVVIGEPRRRRPHLPFSSTETSTVQPRAMRHLASSSQSFEDAPY